MVYSIISCLILEILIKMSIIFLIKIMFCNIIAVICGRYRFIMLNIAR